MSSRNILCLPAAAVITLVLFCSCISNDRQTTNEPPNEENQRDKKLQTLEHQAAELDSMFNVSAREYAGVYFSLCDIYFEKQDYEKAYNAVIKGLQLDSANYPYQYKAAYFEVQNKKYAEASQRIQYIITTSHNAVIIRQCNELLAKFPNIPLEQTAVQPMYSKSILILVFPGTHALAVNAIAERIRQDFKLSVIKEYIAMGEDKKHTRDLCDEYIRKYIAQFYEKYGEQKLVSFLQEIGFTKDDLEKKKQRLVFMQHIFIKSGYNRKDWENFTQTYNIQYDANVLIQQARRYALQKLNDPNILGVLAVTSKDIYSGKDDNNFLFGLYDMHVAVMSLHRFITPETKNSVIINRAVMQGLASAGHLIGIPRCSMKGCARAYAHSLAEQDAKQPHLCFECIRNINAVYQLFD